MGLTWPFPKPFVPKNVEDRLPFIFRQFVDHCDAPLTVWAECFVPAFVNALISWYAVDMLQIFRTMWKPPIWGLLGRSHGHGSRNSKSRKKTFRSRLGKIIGFDVNDWIGKSLNPFTTEEAIMVLPGEVIFWSAIELIAVAAFYWSVIDIGTTFLYSWTSAVARTKYCAARDDAVLQASAPGYPLQGIFGWDVVGILDVVKMRNITFFNGFGVMQEVGPGVVTCTFGYVCLSTDDPNSWIETRMRCLNGPREGTYSERRIDQGEHAQGTSGTTYDMAAGEVWVGEIRVNGAFQIIGPQLNCHAPGFRPT